MTGRQVAYTAGIALAVYVALEYLRSGDPRARELRERAGGPVRRR